MLDQPRQRDSRDQLSRVLFDLSSTPLHTQRHETESASVIRSSSGSRQIRLNAISMPSFEDSSSTSSSDDDHVDASHHQALDPEAGRIHRLARQMSEAAPDPSSSSSAGRRRDREEVPVHHTMARHHHHHHHLDDDDDGDPGSDPPGWRSSQQRDPALRSRGYSGGVQLPPMMIQQSPVGYQVPLPPFVPHLYTFPDATEGPRRRGFSFSTPEPRSTRLLEATSALPPRSSLPQATRGGSSWKPTGAGGSFSVPLGDPAGGGSMARRLADSGGRPTAMDSSYLEDDILELSSRMVRGFIVKVARFALLLAFRLWLATAR